MFQYLMKGSLQLQLLSLKNKISILFIFLFLIVSLMKGECPKRVVSLSPSITDTIFELGMGEKLVGVSSFSKIPEGYKKKIEKVGSFGNLNIERLFLLQPDLIIGYSENIKAKEFAYKYGIKFLEVPHKRIEDIFTSIELIGKNFCAEKKAYMLIKSIKSKISEYKRKQRVKKRVIVVVEREPGSFKNIYIVGKGDFLSQIIEIAGGVNAYKGDSEYPKVSLEFFLIAKPDVLIEINLYEKKDKVLKLWKKVRKESRILREMKVCVLSWDKIVQPGPYVWKSIEKFYRAINKNESKNCS